MSGSESKSSQDCSGNGDECWGATQNKLLKQAHTNTSWFPLTVWRLRKSIKARRGWCCWKNQLLVLLWRWALEFKTYPNVKIPSDVLQTFKWDLCEAIVVHIQPVVHSQPVAYHDQRVRAKIRRTWCGAFAVALKTCTMSSGKWQRWEQENYLYVHVSSNVLKRVERELFRMWIIHKHKSISNELEQGNHYRSKFRIGLHKKWSTRAD